MADLEGLALPPEVSIEELPEIVSQVARAQRQVPALEQQAEHETALFDAEIEGVDDDVMAMWPKDKLLLMVQLAAAVRRQQQRAESARRALQSANLGQLDIMVHDRYGGQTILAQSLSGEPLIEKCTMKRVAGGNTQYVPQEEVTRAVGKVNEHIVMSAYLTRERILKLYAVHGGLFTQHVQYAVPLLGPDLRPAVDLRALA